MTQNEILTRDLNPEQKKAVLHEEGPLLILAGAGSGKTRVITHRIAYLVNERGVDPYRILAITFTNKAAKEMKERIEGIIGKKAEGIWAGTFHSMMIRILRKHIEKLGFSPSFSIADSDEQIRIVKNIIQEMNINEKVFQPRYVHSAISSAKNSLIGEEEFKKEASGDFRKEKIALIYSRYQEILKENSFLDFDDILFFAVKILEENKDVLKFYQEKFRYILVDEYQDTNHAQYTLISLLAKKHKNLCVVGDDDQSIYSFRGANIRNILDFEKDFKNCKVIKLEQNYRSTKTVLDAANSVIGNNVGRKRKKLWTDAPEGDLINFVRTENQNDEARYVASEIKRISQGKYNETAILYRINALSRNFESELIRQGIPYRIYGGMRFFDRKEIRDILAYMRLVLTGDDISFERIINVPKRGIGNVTMETIKSIARRKQIAFLEVCKDAKSEPELSRAWPKLFGFYETIEKLREKLSDDSLEFSEYFEYVQEESGIVQEIIEQREKKAESIDRVENLRELISDAIEFQKRLNEKYEEYSPREEDAFSDHEEIPKTLRDILSLYLENTALYTDADKDTGENDFVRLMTIHSAKGLEFNNVFLVGAEESLFPGSRSIQSGSREDIEEERRLAYVSITRARKKLYITTTKSRMVFGQTQFLPVSRFVKEIPRCYLQEISSGTNDSPIEGFQKKKSSESGGFVSYGFNRAREKDKSDFSSLKNDLPGKNINDSATQNEYLLPEEIKRGDIVIHEKFGTGKIISKSPVANDAILEISFDRTGEKRLMARQAKLKKQR